MFSADAWARELTGSVYMWREKQTNAGMDRLIAQFKRLIWRYWTRRAADLGLCPARGAGNTDLLQLVGRRRLEDVER